MYYIVIVKSFADINREYRIAKLTFKILVERYKDSGLLNINNRTGGERELIGLRKK